MRASLSLLVLSLSACGPDLSAWEGTWSGNAAINTGRLPEVAPGSFVVADTLVATLSLGPLGTPARSFSCVLVATSADAAKAELVAQAPCTETVDAGDGCTANLLFNTCTAQRDGASATVKASGRLTTTCPSGSSAVDLGATLTATRR